MGYGGGKSAVPHGLSGNPKIRRAGGALTCGEALPELLRGLCAGSTQLGGTKEERDVYLIQFGGKRSRLMLWGGMNRGRRSRVL